MSDLHCRGCDCDSCLPPFKAEATRVYEDARPLLGRWDGIARARTSWAKRNPDKARQARARWRERNREHERAYKQARRQRLGRMVAG